MPLRNSSWFRKYLRPFSFLCFLCWESVQMLVCLHAWWQQSRIGSHSFPIGRWLVLLRSCSLASDYYTWRRWVLQGCDWEIKFLFRLIRLEQGGQYMLQFVDYFGASFVAFFLAIAELIAFGWIYGVSRICRDIEFMLGIKTGWYWRICWGIVTPGLMIAIIIYNLATLQPLKYNNYVYPDVMYSKYIDWLSNIALSCNRTKHLF